ncbi:MAG: hypothetical protein WAL63_08950 [Solirubrobacteraceae bacterium]
MSTPGRQALTARIRQIRAAMSPPSSAPTAGSVGPVDRIAALEERVAHLEKLVQGLQDSVYREAQRQDARLDDLEARMQPAALAVALSQNARDRGL